MSRDEYIQHAHRHGPKGSDPVNLDALASGIVQLGGKMPWFETLYNTGAATSGTRYLADDFGGTAARIRTTDNSAGFFQDAIGPQVYTDGTFYACDYSTTPDVAVQVLQPGVYYVHAERLIAYSEISVDVTASVGVMITMDSGHTAFFADSRVIVDQLLTDGASGPWETMAIGRVDAARAVYIDSPATIGVEYLNDGAVSSSQIWLSIFRISDGSGNSAPGSGSGAGIIYDFANTGDWLYVEATDQGGPAVSGIELLSSGSGVMRFVTSLDGTDIQVDSAGGVSVVANYDVTLRASTGDIKFNAGGNNITMSSFGDISFTVGSTEVMQISSDGSIHIRSGTSLIADLP